MASSIIHILLLILFHLLLASSLRILTERKQTGFRTTLTRVSSGKPTTINPLKDSLLTSPLKATDNVYVMNLAIGTPPVPFSAVMDTGSDLIWTKCETSDLGFFDPSKSESFLGLDASYCEILGLDSSCKETYDDGKFTVNLTLGKEILTIGAQTIPQVNFACGEPDHEDLSYDGIVGMGRGDLSLVSQSELDVFAYCLGSRFDSKASSVLMAGNEASIQNINTQTTPLIKQGKSYYYISLEGISVGETKLAVTKSDFAISNGDGGMIIDSGATFTYLEKYIVDMISDEFMNQTKFAKCEDSITTYRLEHCFEYQAGYDVQIPNMVFHFEGADWVLPRENYIYEKQGLNQGCLAFIARNANVQDDNVSVFGNMQQQNMMVIYDLDGNSLSFKPVKDCNQL